MSREIKLCIVCHTRPAVAPDRNTGSLRKKLCRECHADRLTGDMRQIVKHEMERVPMTPDPTRLAAIRQEWAAEVAEHGIWTSGHSIAEKMLAQLDAQAQTIQRLTEGGVTEQRELANIMKATLDDVGAPNTDGMGDFTLSGRIHGLVTRWAIEQEKGDADRARLQREIEELLPIASRVVIVPCKVCGAEWPHWSVLSSSPVCESCRTADRAQLVAERDEARRLLIGI